MNSIAYLVKAHYIMAVHELNTPLCATLGQCLRKHACIAGFVAGGVSAVHNVAGKSSQC